MDQTPTLPVVVAVVVCCGLLSVDDVTTLPLQPCSSLINHVESVIAAAQPLSPDDLRLYVACLGLQQQQSDHDDEVVRQLLALQPSTASADDVSRGEWPTAESVSGDVCATLECLGRRAALTFEPCSRLTQTQCSALVSVLENVISVNSGVDDDAAAARLLLHFRQLVAHYRKWHQNRLSARTKRHAVAAAEEGVNKRDKGTGSDKSNGMTSSRVTSGVGGPRVRRSTVQREIPFQQPERMTPETQEIIDAYLEWRAKNGYGRVSGRWG